jgi:hypothetical protein
MFKIPLLPRRKHIESASQKKKKKESVNAVWGNNCLYRERTKSRTWRDFNGKIGGACVKHDALNGQILVHKVWVFDEKFDTILCVMLSYKIKFIK